MFVHTFGSPQYRAKMASFDYDWTLVRPKTGNTFYKDKEDWTYLFDNIKEVLQKYYDEGYMIVIFTNQTKEWKKEQILHVMNKLDVPLFVPLGNIVLNEDEGKPSPTIFNYFLGSHEINKEDSFFVGDALGRSGDWSNTDKIFAKNIGVKCFSPEEIFYVKKEFTLPDISLDEKEVIIMMGYPGSGKSSMAHHIETTNKDYVIISGDEFKTWSKMKKEAKLHIPKSLIFDATHSSKKKRSEIVTFGQENGYSVKCIHMTTDKQESYKRNKCREDKKQVPLIAFHVYTKHYEEPCETEGFTLVTI